jgi:monoamine oxidase
VSRSPLFADIVRALRIARHCEDQRLSTSDGLAYARAADEEHAARRRSRRDMLKAMMQTGAAGAAASIGWPAHALAARAPRRRSLDVGIVGAGLAGLACADALAGKGVAATVYDANTRAGGRCWSLSGVFPGQTVERGGEFIDNLHKTMLGYAGRFGLSVEDVTKQPGDVFYHFGGRLVDESDVVDEFRAFVKTMHVDLRRLSGDVTALSFTMPTAHWI